MGNPDKYTGGPAPKVSTARPLAPIPTPTTQPPTIRSLGTGFPDLETRALEAASGLGLEGDGDGQVGLTSGPVFSLDLGFSSDTATTPAVLPGAGDPLTGFAKAMDVGIKAIGPGVEEGISRVDETFFQPLEAFSEAGLGYMEGYGIRSLGAPWLPGSERAAKGVADSAKSRELTGEMFTAIRRGDTDRQHEIVAELAKIYGERPFVQQVGGAIIDPLIAWGLFKLAVRPILRSLAVTKMTMRELTAIATQPVEKVTTALVHVPKTPLPDGWFARYPYEAVPGLDLSDIQALRDSKALLRSQGPLAYPSTPVSPPPSIPPAYGHRAKPTAIHPIVLPETMADQPLLAARQRTLPGVAELPSADPGRKLLFGPGHPSYRGVRDYSPSTGAQSLLPETPPRLRPDNAPSPAPRDMPGAFIEVTPPPIGNLIGLGSIKIGLSNADALKNKVRATLGRPFKLPPLNEITTAAFRAGKEVSHKVDSQGNYFGIRMAHLARVFKRNEMGGITSLSGANPALPSLPSIQDVAADLTRYWGRLSVPERKAMLQMREEAGRWTQLRTEYEPNWMKRGVRNDLRPGGFYLPRGPADLADYDAPIRYRGRPLSGGRASYEKPAPKESMAHGVKEGYEYGNFEDVMISYAKTVGRKANDAHVSDFMKKVRDENGALYGSTPKLEAFKKNPALALRVETIRNYITVLRSRKLGLADEMYDNFEKFLNDPQFDNIDGLSGTLERIEKRVKAKIKRGKLKGEDMVGVSRLLQDLGAELNEIGPQYKKLLEDSKNVRGRSSIKKGGGDFGTLSGWTFPDEMTAAADEILAFGDPLTGMPSVRGAIETGQFLNRTYRGLAATGDNSYFGIQGLLGTYDNPVVGKKAFMTSIAAWGRHPEKILGAFFDDFDNLVVRQGRLSVSEWAAMGLRIGGQVTEYQVTGRLANNPIFRRANQAFGVAGDSMRLRWADDELAKEIAKGRSVKEIVASGDLEGISKAVNAMTGWAPTRTFSDIGDLVLFASRFLQSRLNTVALTARSIRPSPTIDELMARRAMFRMIGLGTVLTMGLNKAQGRDTDFRLFVNGRVNSNFMVVYTPIGDISLFGTWGSLLRATANIASGHPERAVRGMGGLLVTAGWDLLGGADFVGRRTRDSASDFALWVARTFSPFAAEEAAPGLVYIAKGISTGSPGSVAKGVSIAGLELSGAALSPRTAVEERDDAVIAELGRWLNAGGAEKLPNLPLAAINAAWEIAGRKLSLRDLSPDIRIEIEKAHEVRRRNAQVKKERAGRGAEYTVYRARVEEINTDIRFRIVSLVEILELDTPARFWKPGDGKSFRTQVRDLQEERYTKLGERRKVAEEDGVLKFLEDYEVPDDELQRDLAQYRAVVFDETLDDLVTGDFDYARYELGIAALVKEWGKRGQGRLQRVQNHTRRFEHKLETELRDDREELKEYWNIRDEVIEARKAQGKLSKGVWGKWQKMDKYQQAAFKDAKTDEGKEIRHTLKDIDLQREVMRNANPRINELLLKWDYKPVSGEEAKKELGGRNSFGVGQ